MARGLEFTSSHMQTLSTIPVIVALYWYLLLLYNANYVHTLVHFVTSWVWSGWHSGELLANRIKCDSWINIRDFVIFHASHITFLKSQITSHIKLLYWNCAISNCIIDHNFLEFANGTIPQPQFISQITAFC